MKRSEIYAKIKAMNLAKEINNFFGDSYTRICNDDLECFINNKTKARSVKATPIECNTTSSKVGETHFKEVVIRIVSTLQGNKLIDNKDAAFILKAL